MYFIKIFKNKWNQSIIENLHLLMKLRFLVKCRLKPICVNFFSKYRLKTSAAYSLAQKHEWFLVILKLSATLLKSSELSDCRVIGWKDSDAERNINYKITECFLCLKISNVLIHLGLFACPLNIRSLINCGLTKSIGL